MDPSKRKKTERSIDLSSPRSLTSPKDDPETARLLKDLKIGESPQPSPSPSPPETPKTPRRFFDRFRSGKKQESLASRGYSTVDPIAAYNLIGQDYLDQQKSPLLQQGTSVTPATPSPSEPRSLAQDLLSGIQRPIDGTVPQPLPSPEQVTPTYAIGQNRPTLTSPINSDILNQESPLSQLRFEIASHHRQQTSRNMDARFLAPATAASITMTKQKEKTIRIAKEQQQALQARLQKNDIEMPPFEFLELIGKGAFGRVFKANDLRRNKIVALKVLDVDPQDFKAHYLEKDESIQSILHEINILTQLRDSGAKNINLFIEAFSIHSQLWIVTEYCPGGSLHTLMQGVGSKLEEKYIIPVARELAIALQASHAAGIIHRDVKAANVMIHENGSLQLIDFGVAGLLQTSKDKRSTIIGTPHWMAPEMSSQLVNQGPPTVDYATEVDVWAYGCTLYEIATGHPPYHRAEPGRKLTMMLKRSAPTLNEKEFSPGLVDLIKFVMKPSPQDRPSMEAILQHPYILGTEKDYTTKSLADLVKMYYRWEIQGGQRSSLFMPGGAEAAAFPSIGGDDEEDWNFSTTMNFDNLYSAPFLAAQQHTSSPNPSFDFEDQPSPHPAVPISHRSAALNYPTSSLHKPRSSLNLSFSMSDSAEMDPAAAFKAKNESEVTITGAPGTANTKGNVERGEKSLQAIFDQSAPDYQYGTENKADDLKTPTANTKAEPMKPSLDRSKSDLPLRNATSGLAVHKEVDKSGINKTPSIDLSSVDTIKANRIISRSGLSLEKQGSEESDADQKGYMDSAKRATMDWTFPSAEETGHDQQATMPARANNRGTLDWSFATAEPVDEENAEHDVPPVRPALRHMATQPIGKLDPRPKSVLDLDALYESEPYESSTAPVSDDEAYAAYDLSDAQEPAPTAPASPPSPPIHPQSSLRAPAKLKMRMLEEMHDRYEVDPYLGEAIIIGDRSDPWDLGHGNEKFAEDLVDDYLAKHHADLPFFKRNALKRDIMDARLDVFSKFLRGDYPFEDYITKYDNVCLGQPYDSSGEEDGEDGEEEGGDDEEEGGEGGARAAGAGVDQQEEGGGEEEGEDDDDDNDDDDPAPLLREVDMRALLPGATDEQLAAEFAKQLAQLGDEVLPWASRQLARLGHEALEEMGVAGVLGGGGEEEIGAAVGGAGGELDLPGGGGQLTSLDINEGEEGGDEA